LNDKGIIMTELASKIDHTSLKQNLKYQDIENLCKEAINYYFASVCILPAYINIAKQTLSGSGIKICTVIDFPLGSSYPFSRLAETELALLKGAEEIDIVMSLPSFFNEDYDMVSEDISSVVKTARLMKAKVKVIVETCLLTTEQKITACKIVSEAGADFIKTSTGFSTGGATLEDIILFKQNVNKEVKIKASGGIKTPEFAMELIQAGADRIGTSSGVEIMKYFNSKDL
jgi:deoxyribose-phosphate aldolase